MKIGLLTYHFSDNYGALLQAYALRQWLQSNNHEVDFINYQPSYVEEGGNFNWLNLLSRDNLKILFLKAVGVKEKVFGNKALKSGFEDFRHEKLGVAGERLNQNSSFNAVLSSYDLLICGSDQIWKPSEHYGVDPVYYLDFKHSTSMPRRIAYAPSFGTDYLSQLYQDKVAASIKKLDGISVREKSGCNIVEQLIGVRPSCVPDPTVLLSNYEAIMKPYSLVSKKYVFCYALRTRNVIGEAAEEIAKHLNVSLYSPHNSHRRWQEIGETVYPCPSQWLYLLKTSDYVVTNSFHGAALSILLKKNFVVVALQGNKTEFNARVLNLLKFVGLESRFINDSNPRTIKNILSNEIDWIKVDREVVVLRKLGTDFLTSELSKVVVNAHE